MRRSVILIVVLAALGTAAALWMKGRSRTRAPTPTTPVARTVPLTNPTAEPARARPRSPALSFLDHRSNEPLAVVLGKTEQPFAARYQALQALKPPLTRAQVEAIYEFLRTPAEHPGTLPGGEHVLKNDLMGLLLRQEPPPADLPAELCALSRNRAQDPVTRDYALQQLVSGALQSTNRFGAERGRVRAALWDALAEKGGSLAGTALLGLHRIARQDQSVESDRLNAAALALASDPAAGVLAQTTALQVCVQRHLPGALPAAVGLAKSQTTLTLRAAAIAAVGDLGGQPEVSLLEALQSGKDPILHEAASAALKRLQTRLPLASQKPPDARQPQKL